MKIHKELWKGSIILLIAFGLFNLFNFLYHLFMARLLSIEDFGILATLFSIIYVLGVFTESIQTVIMKYTTTEKEDGKVKNALRRATKKAFMAAMLLFSVNLVVSIILSPLLNINYFLLAFNGLIIFAGFLSPLTRGVFQGRKRFKGLGMNMIIESITKLTLAIVFVLIGWRVFGAITGAILGVFTAYVLSFVQIRDILKKKEVKTETKELYAYTLPTFIIMLSILAFFGMDVIIAKIFFDADTAGAYSVGSILAKIIFFGTRPVSRAMFPLSAEKAEKKGSTENVFYNALAIVGLGIGGSLVVFWLFPELVLTIFAGRVIPSTLQILFYLGIGTSMFSIANLFLFYKLSRGKVKGHYLMLVFVVVEAVLLSHFSDNLVQFSLAYITSAAAFLWGAVLVGNEPKQDNKT